MLNDRAIEWLSSRGIDPELASKLGLESCKMAGGHEGLKLPFYVGTEAVNHKYRALAEKRFHQDSGATQCFWNFNAICDTTLADQPLVITEGEMDAIAAIQCGVARVVSVPSGAPSEAVGEREDSRKYAFLEHAKSALRDVREIILATDGDEPGIVLMNDLALRLGKARCKWVQYPLRRDRSGRLKDLNEVLVEYGQDGVTKVLARAQWVKVDGIYRMSELPPVPERRAYSTGLEGMDAHYKVRSGDFCVITGVPSHGKTSFVNALTCHLAQTQGWTIAVASFEQPPQTDHRRALRCWHMQKPLDHCTDAELAKADAWIDGHFSFIVPSDDELASLEWVMDKIAASVFRHGAKIVVVDPWNELDHDRPPDMSLTEYTGRAIKEFKRLAKALDVHLILVAHPTKLPGGEPPGLYHISDSAHWANKADVGIVVWKPDVKGTTAEIRIVKSRYHEEIGRPGTLVYGYDTYRRRYVLLPGEEHEAA